MSEEARAFYRRGIITILALLAFFIGVSLVFVYFDLDRKLISPFYDPEKGWFLAHEQPWHFLYKYGTIPGLILTLVTLTIYVYSRVRNKLVEYRQPLLLIFLTAVIGGGIIVNAILKPNWGRPRPRQVTDFGGLWQYREALSPGIPDKGNSFTCGHCTMGFVYCTFLFFWGRSRKIAIIGTGFGLVMGTMLTIARNVQGAHFITDGMWSLAVLLLTASILYFFILKVGVRISGDRAGPGMSTKAKILTIGATALALVVMTTAFLTRRPYFKTHQVRVDITNLKALNVHASTSLSKTSIKYTDQATNRVVISTRGFGWVNGKQYLVSAVDNFRNKEEVYMAFITVGYFSEIEHEVEVRLPKSLEGRVAVKFLEAE